MKMYDHLYTAVELATNKLYILPWSSTSTQYYRWQTDLLYIVHIMYIEWPCIVESEQRVNIKTEYRGHIKQLFNPIFQQADIQLQMQKKTDLCSLCCPPPPFYSPLSFLLTLSLVTASASNMENVDHN